MGLPINNQLQLSPDEASSQERKKLAPINRGLALVNPEGKDTSEMVGEIVGASPRTQYAPMRAHQEAASMVIAVGGTYKMAARYAGVNRRQVHKYMQDPNFRARVDEHRAKMVSGIKGRILGELGRRTKGKAIQNWEIMDLVRVLDRLTGSGGKGMTTIIEGDVNVNKYEGILAALFGPDAGSNGSDFPRFGDQRNVISGDSTPVEG